MFECVLNSCQRKEDLKIQDSYASLYLSKKSDVTSPGILMSIQWKRLYLLFVKGSPSSVFVLFFTQSIVFISSLKMKDRVQMTSICSWQVKWTQWQWCRAISFCISVIVIVKDRCSHDSKTRVIDEVFSWTVCCLGCFEKKLDSDIHFVILLLLLSVSRSQEKRSFLSRETMAIDFEAKQILFQVLFVSLDRGFFFYFLFSAWFSRTKYFLFLFCV